MGWGEKCICGQLFWRKEKAEGHGGWGAVPKPGAEARGAGAECRLSLQRNIPSRNSSHPPPFHPYSSLHSCPLGGLEFRWYFGPKRPRDIISTAMATNREVTGSAAYQEGTELARRAMGAGVDVLSPGTQSELFQAHLFQK